MSDLEYVSSVLDVTVSRVKAASDLPALLAKVPGDEVVSVWSGPAIAGDGQPTIVGAGVARAFIAEPKSAKTEPCERAESAGPSAEEVNISILDHPSYSDLLNRLTPHPPREGARVSHQPHMGVAGDAWLQFARSCRGTDSLEARELEAQTGIRLPVGLMSFGFGPHAPGIILAPRETWIEYEGSVWHISLRSSTPDQAKHTRETAASQREARSFGSQPNRLVAPRGLSLDTGTMSRRTWATAVSQVIELLGHGHAQKAVMARDLEVSASSPIDPRYVCAQLTRTYPTCWIFSVAGLTGASPEMLASVRDGVIKSRVLAGTCAPGDGHALLESAKDREEHHLAVESVTRALGPITSALDAAREPFLLDLPNVTHLATDVRATLSRNHAQSASICVVVSALHPTAAVGGTPTEEAFTILSRHELTERGRYSGPVGWIDAAGEGACAIALRCGQLSADRHSIRVFAGGGIMPDSDPDLEVAETQAKMRPVLQALGLDT
ncbi:MAG: isochorismate synthase [Actinomycetaceae bacterium]|nr:isochorismate synthase [Actinomycetaceae bacterium]